MRLARVFPRRNRATPKDDLAFFGPPDLFAEADEIHIDVTFTADKPRAEQLAEDWKWVGTGELSLPRGATSFFCPASPSVPQAPPGTCVPVEEVWKWRKLVITEPIAIDRTGFPNFMKNF